MGGIFNPINFHLYHYAGNSPIRYVDPDGRQMVAPLVPINPPPFPLTPYNPNENGGFYTLQPDSKIYITPLTPQNRLRTTSIPDLPRIKPLYEILPFGIFFKALIILMFDKNQA